MGEEEKSMKLDDSDYENIFLRVREKLFVQMALTIGLIVAIAGWTSWKAVEAKIAKTTSAFVDKHVQSKEFQAAVVFEYQARLADLEKRSAVLSDEIQRKEIAVASLSSIPIKIDGSNIELMNATGRSFKILTGVVKSGDDVRFKQKFLVAPVVVVVIDSDAKARIGLIHKGSISDAFSIGATTEGFTLPHNTIASFKYRWIAIGE